MEGAVVTSKSKMGQSSSRASFIRVYKRMDEVAGKVDALSEDLRNLRKDGDLSAMVTQRVENKLDSLIKIIGCEEEDGKGGFTGTGLVGRVRRVEDGQRALFNKYKSWIAWGGGFCTSLFAAVAVVWWLVSDKMEVVFKGVTG